MKKSDDMNEILVKFNDIDDKIETRNICILDKFDKFRYETSDIIET